MRRGRRDRALRRRRRAADPVLAAAPGRLRLQPGVAAVGATTLAPDGRVEQGGIAIDDGLPVPMMFATGAGDPGPLGVGVLPANVSAVSGVVAFGGEAFRTLGGLDPELGCWPFPTSACEASRRA